jgi:Tfp pilus assembly protein PilN
VRAVNLLPRDDGRSKKKGPSSVVLVGAMGVVIVAAAVASMTFLAGGTVAQKRQELDGLRIELQAIPEPPPPPSAVEAGLVGERQARAAAVGAALGNRISWDQVLRRFALVLPADVWLESLSASAPTGAELPGATPNGFLLAGYAYSHDGVARLLSRLQVLPDLRQVTLQDSTTTPLGGREMVRFTIVANLRPPESAAETAS